MNKNNVREKIKKLINDGIVPIVYIDMDGVIADFEDGANQYGMTCKEFKMKREAYLHLKVYPHAFEVIDLIEKELGVKIFILTKIPDDNPYAATEKLLWLREKAPNRAVNVTITPDKGSVGDEKDYLIDDRPHKASVKNFKGTLLVYGENGDVSNWIDIANYFGVSYNI